MHVEADSDLGCDERRAGFRPFPALLSEVQKRAKETYMSLEHLKELIEDDARDGYIYDYSDVELTLALLQEKIDGLTSRDKEKLRAIIEADLARDLKAMQCITTKIHDEINADLAWAWRRWEKEYVAAEEWGSEKRGVEFSSHWCRRVLISRTVKRLILPRLEAKAGDQKPHQGRLGPLSDALDQRSPDTESQAASKPSIR
jgi:cell fate (sporulation/competence/biofilm development) regulator YlbF (YheA/YmcA/DUF963 family)